MIKVSVIIPIYNVEKYLEECLNSVFNQTLKGIEIICIDDGSTDGSLNILNQHHITNSNHFKIISQDHSGKNVALNKGMNIANGKYIYIMDSEDILKLSALEELYYYAESKKADFVLFQAKNYSQENQKYYETNLYNMNNIAKVIGESVVNYIELDELIFSIAVDPWNKLIKHELIKNNNIEFPEILISNDDIFFWDLLFNANNIAFYKHYLYTHRVHSSQKLNNKYLQSVNSIKINNLIIEKFKEHNVFNKFKKKLYNIKINTTYKQFVETEEKFQKKFFEKLQEDYNKIVFDKQYNDYITVLNTRNKMILNTCLNSNTFKEFKYEMAYWDSMRSREHQKQDIENLKQKFETKKTESKFLKKNLNIIDKENITLRKNNKTITEQNNDFKKIIEKLDNQNNKLKKDNKTITEQNNDFKKIIETQQRKKQIL